MSARRRRPFRPGLMQELADHIDRVTQADRLFFERFPHRQHRVRLTSPAEIEQQKLLDGRSMTIPPGYRWFTAVHNIAPGYHLCLFVADFEGAETDLDEAMARGVFERTLKKTDRDSEVRLRRAARARP